MTKLKKSLAILLAVLFLVTVTAGAVNAFPNHKVTNTQITVMSGRLPGWFEKVSLASYSEISVINSNENKMFALDRKAPYA